MCWIDSYFGADPFGSLFWLSEQGNAFAQYKLGEMYDKGEGVTKDSAKAVEWWQKAAAQDNDAAKESLKSLKAK